MGLIAQCFPLHDHDKKNKLLKEWISTPGDNRLLDRLRIYAGTDVAFYFGWLAHYTTWLLFPAVAGIVLFLHQSEQADSTAEALYAFKERSLTPASMLFAVSMSLWATALIAFWDRRSAEYAFQWGVDDANTEDLLAEPRPEYHGRIAPNEVTGKLEPCFSPIKRYLIYAITWPIMGLMVLLVIAISVGSISVREYIEAHRQEFGEYASLYERTPGIIHGKSSSHFLYLFVCLCMCFFLCLCVGVCFSLYLLLMSL